MATLGIDVSKADFHACLIEGSKRGRKSFPNGPAGYRQLMQWMKNRKCSNVHACMEATGAYWLKLATALDRADIKVSVVNPSRTVMFARSQLRRTKTDAVDAEMIAEFCQSQSPAIWTPPAPETLELRGFLSYRAQLVAQRVALKQLATQVEANVTLRRMHAAQMDSLDETIDELEKQMQMLVKRHATLRQQVDIVRSIPGFGFLSSAAVVARLPIERIRDAKAAGAYVGLTPADRQSGTSVLGVPRICKTGNAELRRDLYMPALAAMRHNPTLSTFAARLKSKGKHNKVVIVAVMRKLITLAYTLLTKGIAYSWPAPLDMQHGI